MTRSQTRSTSAQEKYSLSMASYCNTTPLFWDCSSLVGHGPWSLVIYNRQSGAKRLSIWGGFINLFWERLSVKWRTTRAHQRPNLVRSGRLQSSYMCISLRSHLDNARLEQLFLGSYAFLPSPQEKMSGRYGWKMTSRTSISSVENTSAGRIAFVLFYLRALSILQSSGQSAYWMQRFVHK